MYQKAFLKFKFKVIGTLGQSKKVLKKDNTAKTTAFDQILKNSKLT